MRRGALLVTGLLCLTLFSCQLFESDVADFMETYTETANIEEHSIKTTNYKDLAKHICLPSDENAELSFVMRNPKKFNLTPSIKFLALDEGFDTSAVVIKQQDPYVVNLNLPQQFLIPTDEGKSLKAEVSLYEPMSGRTFDKYPIDIYCNSIPPQIENATILNNAGSTFVIAFDMPNEEEVAIRHKDLSEIEINGTSYPVSISLNTDSDGIKHAVYSFEDSRFTRTENSASPYTRINSKDFEENINSVYFETGEAFFAGDKEYTLVLKDSAGLSSTVVASTSIAKLLKPVIKNQNGSTISEGRMTGIPFDEESQKGRITIYPPEKDHLGNPVSGATIHYKVYEATGSGILYTSGTSTEPKTIELPQNTYRVEAYATLTNYEKSSTTTVKFRFVNNILYVNPSSVNGDGSEAAPWATMAQAFADINDPSRRREPKFTIYVEGNLEEDIAIESSLNVDELEIEKKSGATSATVKSITVNCSQPVTLGAITVSNTAAQGIGVKVTSAASLTMNGTVISDCKWYGLQLTESAGTVDYTEGSITGNSVSNSGKYCGNTAVYLQGGTCNLTNVAVNDNNDFGIVLENSAHCNLTDSSVNNNGFGIYLASTSAVCSLNNTSVTGNSGGVDLKSEFAGSTANGGTLNVKGNTVINNNVTANVILSANGAGSTVHVNGALASTARIGVTSVTLPTGDDKLTVTSGYSTYNSTAPGYIFFSDAAYGVMLYGGEAAISQSSGIISHQFEYSVEFNLATGCDTTITPGQAKTITVTPLIKRNNVDITSTVPAADLQWELYVTCHSDTVKTSATNSITLDAASVNNDVYYLHVNLTYKGRLFDTQIRLAPASSSTGPELIFESTSIADLKTMIEAAEDGTTIVMKNGVVITDEFATINITTGKTVTLKRAPGYTGALITASSQGISVNQNHNENSGYLVLDGGSEDGIVATAPLFIDNYGCNTLYNMKFQNNNNANGDGGAVYGGPNILQVSSHITQFNHCSFTNCRAKNGGAGYFNSSVTFMLGSTIQNCSASEAGGALYLTAYNQAAQVYVVYETPVDWSNIPSDAMISVFENCSAEGIDGGNHHLGDKIYFHKGSYGIQINNVAFNINYKVNN